MTERLIERSSLREKKKTEMNRQRQGETFLKERATDGEKDTD